MNEDSNSYCVLERAEMTWTTTLAYDFVLEGAFLLEKNELLLPWIAETCDNLFYLSAPC